MRPLIDCPSCACLMDTRESACPFCGAVVRRAEGWSVLGLGFMVGLATAACGDKTGTSDSAGTDSTSSTSNTSSADATTGTSDGETTIGDSAVPTEMGGGTAYAGPDVTDTLPDETTTSTGNSDTGTESETETETGTSSGTETGTGTDSGGSTSFPGTSAYAGPDADDISPKLN